MYKTYVKQIVRKLKCPGKKRKEIRRQLIAEIEDAYGKTADIKELEDKMGIPAEIAEEFNQNFSEEERRGHRREKCLKAAGGILLCLVLLLGIVYWALPRQVWIKDSHVFDDEKVVARAEYVLTLFNDKDYEAMASVSDETMQDFLVEESLEGAKTQISADWGAWVSWGKSYAAEVTQMGKKSAVVQMHVNYENVSVLFTLSFNEEMELQGFFMK